MIDVFFDDVVEYGDSAFMGCELLAEDGNANCCVRVAISASTS